MIKQKVLTLLVLLMTVVTGAWAGTKATGYVDHCTAHHGSIHVDGWAYDPDQPSVSINVHAYIWYGTSVGTTKEERMPAVGILTDVERSDVNSAKGITGVHGFDRYITVPAGTYTVQIYAIDKTGDGNPVIPGAGSNGQPAAFTVTVTDPYNITYDANGGSGAPDAQQKSEYVQINLSGTEPTREGYTFKGWNTAQDGSGDSYALGATYTANGDATLYAQWDPTYTVSLAEGTEDAANWTISPASAAENETVTITYAGTKSVKSVTAKRKTTTGNITVYFTDAQDYGDVHVYYWNDGPEWPGTAMTEVGTNEYSQKIYRAEIPATAVGIIFNGNGNQTVDITENIADGSWWYTTDQLDGWKNKVGYVGKYTIEVTNVSDNQWTFTMPDCNVELDIEYYPAYPVTIDDAGVDASNWQAAPAEQSVGQTVTLQYTGKKKVKSITIEKAAE